MVMWYVNVNLIMVARFIRIDDNLIRLFDGGNVFIHFFFLMFISCVSELDLINNGEQFFLKDQELVVTVAI